MLAFLLFATRRSKLFALFTKDQPPPLPLFTQSKIKITFQRSGELFKDQRSLFLKISGAIFLKDKDQDFSPRVLSSRLVMLFSHFFEHSFIKNKTLPLTLSKIKKNLFIKKAHEQ